MRISYEKAEYIESKHQGEGVDGVKYGNIERTEMFKYLGELIQPKRFDKEGKGQKI